MTITLEPGSCVPERSRLESAKVLSPLDFTADKPGTLQHHDVLRDSVEGYGEGLCNFGDGCGMFCQGPQDGASRRVSDCIENTVKRFLGIFNHMVEYTQTDSKLSTLLANTAGNRATKSCSTHQLGCDASRTPMSGNRSTGLSNTGLVVRTKRFSCVAQCLVNASRLGRTYSLILSRRSALPSSIVDEIGVRICSTIGYSQL